MDEKNLDSSPDLTKIIHDLVEINEENGLETTPISLVYRDLTVTGKNTVATVLKDVTDVFFKPLALIYNCYHKRPKNTNIDLKKLPKERKIIRNVSGFADPGTMTLVIGRPGAGCSTYLKAIAGETKTYVGVDGLLSFNGLDVDAVRNLIVYNPELDIHFPHLTVEQTLKFVISCTCPQHTNSEATKDLYESLFSIKSVEKTFVGDDYVRGISGGERKRVSIAEAMAVSGSVYCFDNATRGLDSNTASQFVQALRIYTDVAKITSITSIYQASENIYNLFDYVSVLYLGRQIYFGPADCAVEYFQNLGFYKHPRETSSEFLSSMSDPLVRVVDKSKKLDNIPSTPDEFEQVWLNSKEYADSQSQIDTRSASFTGELPAHAYRHSSYWSELKACCVRRFHVVVNNRAYPFILIFAGSFQSLVVGSLMYNTPGTTAGAFSKGGVIFFALLYFTVMVLAEIPAFFLDKLVLNKQFSYNLYHPSAELLAKHLAQFPVRLTAITIFCIILYFLADLKREPGAFFQYYLSINILVQTISSFFTMIACSLPNFPVTMGVSGICMMSLVIYSSYMIQRPSMHWWFKWISYANPVFYAFEAIILMQFRHTKMPCTPEMLIPSGPGYENINTVLNQVCGFVGAAASKSMYDGANDVNGEIYLELAFGYTFDHVWRDFGILMAFLVGYTLISCIIVEVYNPITASSDHLVFVKDARITKKMYQHITTITAEKEDDTIDLEKLETDDSSSSTAFSETKLGSDTVFTWKNLNYSVPYNGEDRMLSNDVQGYVLPGTLTALMGASGAGKTTLLNVLSRRTDVGVVTGDMFVNGKPVDASFERRTGYVQQQDLHIAELTVRESLIFSARLRRPRSVPDEEKIEYVESIMRMLHMEDYADSIAGRVGYGLNVEQRKKLSIATELVAKPSLLLFLDEPTSGLDSESSFAIIQALKELAKAGQAILCTIHQPSVTLFEQFDRLLLLKKGGETVYFGDIGPDSRTIVEYFERNGGRKCLASENPAEYILDIVGAGEVDWFKAWKESIECNKVSAEIDELNSSTFDKPVSDEYEWNGKYATNYLYQFQMVFNRTFVEFYRSLQYITSKFFTLFVAGLVVGFSFWKVKHTIIGMQNVMFAVLSAMIVCNPLMNQIQGKAIASRSLFEVRESKSNTFHWSCLLISQYLNEIPYAVLFSTIYYICWYFPIQLDRSARVAGFFWFDYCILFQLWYPSFALLLLYIAPDLPSANVLLGLMFNFCLSFSGVFQRPYLMPGFWKFMWRTSPITYYLGNLLAVCLHDRPVKCSKTEYNYLQPPNNVSCGDYLNDYFESHTGYVNNPNDFSNCEVCEYNVGDDFINSIGIYYHNRWRNVGFYFVYICFNITSMNILYYVFRVAKFSPKKMFSAKK